MTVEITIVPESGCPNCGGGAEFTNRPKWCDAAGTWWWRCYNGFCPKDYYDPDTGRTQ